MKSDTLIPPEPDHGHGSVAVALRRVKRAYCFLASAFLIHAAEECVTGLYLVSPFFDLFSTTSHRHAAFLAMQVFLFLFLGITFLFLNKRPVIILSASFVGIVFLVELEHYIEAIRAWRYVPGLVTALFLPGFMAWFILECIRDLRTLGR